MIKWKTVGLIATISILSALSTQAFAQQIPPHVFLGTVTSVDGSPVPDGVQVTAWVEGNLAAQTTASDGRYTVLVEQPEGSSFAGRTVSFRIGGASANETAVWEQGGATELNLTASSGIADGTAVNLAEIPEVGQYLVDQEGIALYLFTTDNRETATSNCTGRCAELWPPLVTDGAPMAGAGVNAALLGTTERNDGTTQVTYNGWPLYYYFTDQTQGDIEGQDRGGVWYLVNAAGEAINEWSITIPIAESRGSGQSGTATLTAMGPQTQISVQVTPGPEADDPQPIHVHFGQCGVPLERVNIDLTEGNTTGLTAGTLTATVDTILINLADGNHAINIHKSQPEVAVYTACGNIPRIGSGTHINAALSSLVNTERLEIASVFSYRTGQYDAFVPGQEGNTLSALRPNSVIVVTLREDTTVTVGDVSFNVKAGVPTPLPVGDDPTITMSMLTVVAFDPAANELPEGLAVSQEGDVYVGLALTGEVRRVTPEGQVSTFASLPSPGEGFMTGMTFGQEGNLYVAMSSFEPETHGIWRVNPEGSAELFAALTRDGQADGLPNVPAFDSQGNLYVSDTQGGQIWRIDQEGEVTVWKADPLLEPAAEALPPIPMPVGANGIVFDSAESNLYVANTNFGRIVRIPVNADGSAGEAQVFVEDQRLEGADGITFDRAGNLYVAVNFQDRIAVVSPEGDIDVVAQGGLLQFPAEVKFGRGEDNNTLYITSFAFLRTIGVVNEAPRPALIKMEIG